MEIKQVSELIQISIMAPSDVIFCTIDYCILKILTVFIIIYDSDYIKNASI